MNSETNWTFFSNHTHVLVCLARNSQQSLREVAIQVGITERAVQRIVSDLEQSGYLKREKCGRRNSYVIHPEIALRHPLESHRTIGDLLEVVATE